MSRLTRRYEYYDVIYLEARPNTNCSIICGEMHDCESCPVNIALKKLADYEDKEEQGLLISLPCKVGDTIFDICGKEICSYKITGFSFGTSDNFVDEPVQEDDIIFYCSDSTGIITGSFTSCEIGKIIFLTRSEAESALAKMGGK